MGHLLHRTVAIAIACVIAAGDAGGQMFRGGADHAGVYPATARKNVGGVRWRVQTDGPVRGAATIAGNVVYFGSTDGVLYAVSKENGAVRWRRNAGSPIGSTPAVSANLVFFSSRDGRVHAVRTSSGRVAWTAATGREYPWEWGREGWDYYQSSPVVVGNFVIVGGSGGGVHAFDRATGKPRWVVHTAGRVRSSPAVSNGVAFVGSADGYLYAIDVATGQVKWKFATAGVQLSSARWDYDRKSIVSSPAVSNGRVFVGSRDGHFYAIDAATGRQLWRIEHAGTSWGVVSPAVADSVVFAGTSDTRGTYAVRAATGDYIWRDSLDGWAWSSPALTGLQLIVGDAWGSLHSRDSRTGKVNWKFKLPAPIYSSPVIADSTIYVGSDDGALYAVNTTDGASPRRAVYWDEALRKGAALGGRPGDERLAAYFGSTRGFERLDGTRLATFMTARVSDRTPSVIAFPLDRLPDSVTAGGSSSLFRRYLDSGGKVLWFGYAPLLLQVDSAGVPNDTLRRERSSSLLGVNHDSTEYGEYGSWVTPTGKCLGLPRRMTGDWAVAGDTVTHALSVDERRQVAWIREYGHPGRGFVRLWPTTNPSELEAYAKIAEAGVTMPRMCEASRAPPRRDRTPTQTFLNASRSNPCTCASHFP